MRLRHRTSVVLSALCAACLCGGAAAAAQAFGQATVQTDPREAALLASLADWSGWSPQRLHDLRAVSGEDDAEDFAVAVVVALNLGVSTRALVEDGMRHGLLATLRGMGISSDTARRELRRAEQQVRGWRRQPPPAAPAAVPVSVSPGA
jgi:hypothetical protein